MYLDEIGTRRSIGGKRVRDIVNKHGNTLLSTTTQLLWIDGHRIRTVIRLVNTDQTICQLEHVVSERDHDELGILRSLLNIVSNNAHVSEIKGSIDLIHHIQRSGLVMVQSEDQGERRQRFLSSTKVADILPGLLGRTNAEDNTFREGIEGINQLQLGITAQCDHLIHLLQLECDDVKSIHELRQTLFTKIIIFLADGITGSSHFVEFLFTKTIFSILCTESNCE